MYKRQDNSLSVRANYGKTFLRAGFDYAIEPDSQVDRYFTQANYYHNNRLSGEARFDHQPNQDFSKLRLSGNYTNKYYRSSPFIEVDSDNDWLVGFNMNFNLIDTPFETKPLITSDRSVGRGLVSSFVFHDKNGNNLFDNDDEPLPDVCLLYTSPSPRDA